MAKLRIATRGSALALWQTRWVADQLRAIEPGLEVEEVQVVTQGDRVQDRPLHEVGGKGLFVSEVEAYVARGEADLAVHSLKDVPGDTDPAPGLGLVCFPEREDPRDVLITREGEGLMDLSAGSVIGTTSLRRETQLRRQRGDLAFKTLRGNVDTRLRKLDEGRYDGIVLAAAGLRRLGLLEGRAHQVLDLETCLPAIGQGTLGLEARLDDAATLGLVRQLEHAPTRVVTEAERALLIALQGSCRVPIAGHAVLSEGRLHLRGLVGDIEGRRILDGAGDVYLRGRTDADHIDEAKALGREVAEGLIARGAHDLMRDAEAAVLRRSKLN